MNKRLYWGLAALVILICVVCAIVMFSIETDTEQKKVYKPAEEQVSPIADQQPPRPAREGFKWEHHGEHWHEVEIIEPVEPKVADVDKPVEAPLSSENTQKTNGGVTHNYSALLETDPVEALRQYAKDVGHWSYDYIPPFPRDDIEAATRARAIFTRIDHFKIKGFTDSDPVTPALKRANRVIAEYQKRDREIDYHAAKNGYMPPARHFDLQKLSWVNSDSPHASYAALDRWPSSFDNEGGTR